MKEDDGALGWAGAGGRQRGWQPTCQALSPSITAPEQRELKPGSCWHRLDCDMDKQLKAKKTL